MNNRKVFEEALLREADLLIEQAESQAEKIIFGWFKTAILKKYKDAFDKELEQGIAHKENINKAIDYCFDNACSAYRMIPGLTDEQKENDIKQVKIQLPSIRQTIYNILAVQKIDVIQ